MEQARFSVADFSPSEAAEISGLSQTMQRDWRRRGFLPSNEGRARFTAFEVASMLAMKLLSDQKIGPSATQELAPKFALGIVCLALTWCEAWEGDHKHALSWEEDLPAPEPMNPRVKKFAEDIGDEVDLHWPLRGRWLTRTLLLGLGVQSLPDQYFAWFADGSHDWQQSVEKFFKGTSFDERYHGAVIIIDQRSLAELIMSRARRPLVTVDLPRDEDGFFIRPMEFGPTVPIEAVDG